MDAVRKGLRANDRIMDKISVGPECRWCIEGIDGWGVDKFVWVEYFTRRWFAVVVVETDGVPNTVPAVFAGDDVERRMGSRTAS